MQSASAPTPPNTPAPSSLLDKAPGQDQSTFVLVVAVIISALILIGLVGALTLLPAAQLTSVIAEQAAIAQEQATTGAARQTEAYFNGLANELLALIQHTEVQSTTLSTRAGAMAYLKEVGERRGGVVKSIVRADDAGNPVYAWPDALNQTIVAGGRPDWSIVDRMPQIVQTGGVQFFRRSSGDLQGQRFVYLMVSPIPIGASLTEALVFELDLTIYFKDAFKTVRVSPGTQLWVASPVIPVQVLYERLPEIGFRTDGVDSFTNDQFANNKNYESQPGYPNPERNTGIAPVFSGFTQNRGGTPALVIITNRSATEGQDEVFQTRNRLFVAGLGVVLLIFIAGFAVVRYVIVTANRRRKEEQRRSTVRTLLEMSRALNSSLDLPIVLNKILDELAALMPYDSASVMLLDDEEPDDATVRVAAQRGFDEEEELYREVPLKKLRGTREVVRSGRPVVINDAKTDPRWNNTVGSSRISSWMGVPLRIREKTVGVLNINSVTAERFKFDDGELAEAFADQACVAIENARAHEMQIKQYETELETAHAIQTSLLPSEVPPVPNIEIAAESLPARHVSGDYFQYLPLPDGKLGVAVGDVSGKGIPAALLMAVITTQLREEVLRHKSPATLLNQLNMNLLDRMQQNHMNSALLIAIFDPGTRRVELANGGMVQPYVRTPDGWEFVPVGGYPLGASARSNYQSKTVTLAPGSMLLFISDGVIEAQNAAHEFFGFERFEALLNGLPTTLSSRELVDCILEAVHAHLGGLEAQDDITVVSMKSQDN